MEKYKDFDKALDALFEVALKEFSQLPLQGGFYEPPFKIATVNWKCKTDVALRLIVEMDRKDNNLRSYIIQVIMPLYEQKLYCFHGEGTTEDLLRKLEEPTWRKEVKEKYEGMLDEMFEIHAKNQEWVHDKFSAFESTPIMSYAEFKTYIQAHDILSSTKDLGCGWIWFKTWQKSQWVYNDEKQKYVQLAGDEKNVTFIDEDSFPDSTINLVRRECPNRFPYVDTCLLHLTPFNEGRLQFEWIIQEYEDGLSYRDCDGFGIDDTIQITLRGYFNEDFELTEIHDDTPEFMFRYSEANRGNHHIASYKKIKTT